MHDSRRTTRPCRRLWLALCGLAAMLTVPAFAGTPGPSAAPASGPPQSNQIIVKYNSGLSVATPLGQALATSDPGARAAAVTAAVGVDARFVRRVATGADVYRLDGWRSHADIANRLLALNADPNVEYAEIDALLQPLATPNDTRYNEQWHYFEATGGLNLPTAWDTTTGSGAVVAVLDTGYRPHADLAANLLPGYDMIVDTFVSVDGDGRDPDASDPGDWSSAGTCGFGQPARSSSWHGTHVAGTVAAVTNNGSGVAGVAWNAQVVPVRVLGRCGGYTSDIADGIVWAAGGTVSGVPANPNPADVINMSLGGGGSCASTTQSAINSARANGATIVVAAGNSNANAANYTPASCSGVVSVAATNRSGSKSYYSNYGSVVDLAAPGGDTTTGSANGVLSTLNSGSTSPGADSYAFYQGTSMAAPHVAGLAALMKSVDPSLTPDQVEATLKATARAFPGSCSQCGAGIADAAAAIAAVVGGPPPPPPPPGSNELTNGVPVTGLAASTGDTLMYTLEVPAGASNLSFSISGGSGDADLYVRFGAEPTTSAWDCRPYRWGNSETCSFSSPQAGTWYVMLRAYSSFAGVTLVGSFDEPGSGGAGGSLTENDLSASYRSWLRYTIEVPEGMSTLTVSISGGSGDADLYVRYGAQPSTRYWDCRPYRNGNNETCTFSNPPAGTWHIGIRAYRSFSGVDLYAEWAP